MPSSSRINVSVMAQISRSRCQSVEFRARRETSSPRTNTGSAHAHFHHESLESLTVGRRCGGLAQIAVYGDNLITMPPEGDGTFPKRILTCCALGVLDDLARSGLTDIQKDAAFEVTGGHLLVGFNAHGRISGAWLRAIAANTSTTSYGGHSVMGRQRSDTGASCRERWMIPKSMHASTPPFPANKEGHAQAPRTRSICGLLPPIFVSRDQRSRLNVPRAAQSTQRRFFSCRPSARSMLRGWAVMAKRFWMAAAKSGVHSTNSNCPTSTGLSQRHSAIFAAVNPCPQRPLIVSGRFANGHFAVSRPRNYGCQRRTTAGCEIRRDHLEVTSPKIDLAISDRTCSRCVASLSQSCQLRAIFLTMFSATALLRRCARIVRYS
jgi:hypothetical protein